MGQVFLSEDLKLQRRAALKLMSSTLTRDETRRQRFVQEARVAASIDHPHIAAVYDIDEVDRRTYIRTSRCVVKRWMRAATSFPAADPDLPELAEARARLAR